jgi:hypothetical protein
MRDLFILTICVWLVHDVWWLRRLWRLLCLALERWAARHSQ